MSVISREEADKLILDINNGDWAKLKQVMTKWRFKDYQSLIRFAVSILVLSEEESVTIKKDGIQKNLMPASDLLKEAE